MFWLCCDEPQPYDRITNISAANQDHRISKRLGKEHRKLRTSKVPVTKKKCSFSEFKKNNAKEISENGSESDIRETIEGSSDNTNSAGNFKEKDKIVDNIKC